MISDRDTDRILRAWFQEGAAPLPDRVLDTVVAGLRTTTQRRRLPLPLPSTPGLLRRSWLRTAAVAALLLVIVAGIVLVAGGRLMTQPRARLFVTGDELLPPGRYVIDAPFALRLGIDVPPGWRGSQLESSWASLVNGDSEANGQLHFTFVHGLYADPCNADLGLQETLGPSADDLAAALRALPGVEASDLTHAIIGGRPAAAVTLTAPASFAGCSPGEPRFRLWGLPDIYPMAEGGRARIWILPVGASRLVVVAEDAGPGPVANELEAMVASMDLDVDPLPLAPNRAPSLGPDEILPTLPATGEVPAGPYAFEVPIHAEDGRGGLARLPGTYDMALAVPAGWVATGRGLGLGSPQASASLSAWTIARVHLDPCRWASGSLGAASPAMMLDTDRLAEALSAWWPPDPDPVLVTGGYVPPPDAPRAARPFLDAWNSHPAWRQVLEIARDIDLASCDQGQYRLWSDPQGVARTAQPGERIQLWIIDLEPGIVVLDAAHLPAASAATRASLAEMTRTVWIGASLAP